MSHINISLSIQQIGELRRLNFDGYVRLSHSMKEIEVHICKECNQLVAVPGVPIEGNNWAIMNCLGHDDLEVSIAQTLVTIGIIDPREL